MHRADKRVIYWKISNYLWNKKTKSKQAGTNKHQLEGNSIKLKKRKSIGERINEAKSWFWEKIIKIIKVLTSSRKRGGHVTTYNLALEGQMEETVELRAIPGYGMRPSLKTLRASWCGGINSNPSTMEAEVGGLTSKPGGNAQRAQVTGCSFCSNNTKV